MLEPLRRHQHEQEESERTGGEERVGAPAPRRQSSVREHEGNREWPGEEGRPQRREQRRPRTAGKRSWMRPQRDPGVGRCGEHRRKRQRAEDENPSDRVAGTPGHDQGADSGRYRDRAEEEGVEPHRAGFGDVLHRSDPVEHQPTGAQGDCDKRKPPGKQTRSDPHALILPQQSASGQRACTGLSRRGCAGS